MWRDKLFFNIIYLFIILQCVSAAEDHPAWQWQCEDSKCVKTKHDPRSSDTALSLEACKMFCNEYGLLWPRPTGNTDLGRFLSKININNIEIQILKRGRSNDLMSAAGQRFKKLVSQSVPNGLTPKATGKAVYVYLVNANPDVTDFSLDFDESYGLRVSPESNERINATIFGNTFFGVRHGLETLSQLIVYDDFRNHLLMARDVIIDDNPVYPYRGILLDTARNYFSVDSIKATIAYVSHKNRGQIDIYQDWW
ncbi:unnamed protein product [Euphydryas editha]|uniref:beta-N-acetylhexosaminidase n=1 Tax=Euphydryas editha TaxID=104508 RepID=A0AAU9V872_EUPED|nr:unnamed protein product [Euphydryas editha]